MLVKQSLYGRVRIYFLLFNSAKVSLICLSVRDARFRRKLTHKSISLITAEAVKTWLISPSFAYAKRTP